MPLPSATAPDQAAHCGVFGYLPGHPDLVRVRASSREVRALESWIERGLHQARWEMGSGFAVAYPGLTHRFVFRPDNADSVLLGVLYASQDSHQRPFPFVAFVPLPTVSWDQHGLDLLRWNEPLFADLEALIQDVAQLPQLGQVHGRVLYTRAPQLCSAAPAAEAAMREQRRYENFLAEVTCGELGPPGAGVMICRQLIALLGTGQARDPRNLRAAIALPLHRPTLARALELRFYLELCAALLAPARPTLTLFWQLGSTADGSLLLGFREPTIDVFGALLRGAAPTRGIYYPGRDAALAALPVATIRDDLPLGALLAAVTARASGHPLATYEHTPSMGGR